jgi:transcriptional regulator with XRE-family HTH domain
MPPTVRRPRLLEAKAALVRAGLRQRDLAAKLQVTQTYVCDVLNGREKLPARFRAMLAEMVGRPEAELFPEDGS